MPVTFEHKSIGQALACVGLTANGEEGRNAKFTTVPVFLSWSDRGTLLLQPAYAWLSLEGVVFIRLPQPYTYLLDCFQLAKHSFESSNSFDVVRTLLGQWLWGLNELKSSIRREDLQEARSRLIELRRFATKNWPGWYEGAFASIPVTSAGLQSVEEKVRILIESAGTVATIEACKPITGWVNDISKYDRVALLEDALCYVNQGLDDVGSVMSVVESDDWWVDLEADLRTTQESLEQVRTGGGQPDELLRGNLSKLASCIVGIRSLAMEVGSSPGDNVRMVYDNVKFLLSIIRDINGLQGSARLLLRL